MLYVCSIHGGTVEVKDTEDGVVESMGYAELVRTVRETGVKVLGVAYGRVEIPHKAAIKAMLYQDSAKKLAEQLKC